MPAMESVQFENDGHVFTCRTGPSPATPGTDWWWMQVAGESQRYAAFRTAPGDNEKNLQPRIIAYYAQLLADRARPREFRPAWTKPAPKTEAPKS